VTQVPTPSTIEEWVASERPQRIAADTWQEFDDLVRHWSPAVLGLTGPIPDILVGLTPSFVPVKVWGGSLGWPSQKRLAKWKTMMAWWGLPTDDPARGVLLCCRFDPRAILPHPIIPPIWALEQHDRYFPIQGPTAEAEFDRIHQWLEANESAIHAHIEPALAAFDVQVVAHHYYTHHSTRLVDYCDLAFHLTGDEGSEPTIGVASVWKGETALAELVRRFFPDAQRQYSPDWLHPQRLDVYVPSLKLAFEYQGQQHYEAVEHFGGEEALHRNQERDRRKAARCRKAGVTLIEWPHHYTLSPDRLRHQVLEAGLPWPNGN